MAVATPLTTRAEMTEEIGCDALLEYTDHDDNGAEDCRVLNRAIDRATRELLRGTQLYSAAALAVDDEMRAWATILACFFLAKTRGNPAPDSLADDVDWIREQLRAISTGEQTLSGIAMKADLRPAMTNRTVDRRFSYRTVRKRPDSTGPRSVLKEDRVIDHQDT